MFFKGGEIVKSAFQPYPMLKNQHLQTLWPTFFRKAPVICTSRERLFTPDGDFIDIDWLERPGQPLVFLVHGLASSSRAKYITGLQCSLAQSGFASVAINLRGCSGEPNRKSVSYHGGASQDLNFVITTLQERFPGRPLGGVGFSLGANILLKWLAEHKEASRLFAAVSVSAPLLLNLATEKLQRGFSRVYEQYLLGFMKWNQYQKIKALRNQGLHDELQKITQAPSLWKINSLAKFDEYFTAPLHGFADAAHYYQTSSTRPRLKEIKTPTLILHAKDDPFMPTRILPEIQDLSSSVRVEVSEHGGHVGFITSQSNGSPAYWLEERIPMFFSQFSTPSNQ
jgi:predicted alpha/beta-fold hydrolase